MQGVTHASSAHRRQLARTPNPTQAEAGKSRSGASRSHRVVALLPVLLLAVAVGALAFAGSYLSDPRFHAWRALDVWFESDAPRVIASLVSRTSEASVNRADVHPLFLLIGYGPVQFMRIVLHLDTRTAISGVLAAIAGGWTLLLFAVLRTLGLTLLDALLFTLVGLTSATAMFWLMVPETYAFGSVTILFALLLAAAGNRRLAGGAWDESALVLTLGITVTNWVYGILASIARRPWREALQHCVNGFVIVVLAWTVQHHFFPDTRFFLDPRPPTNYLTSPESGGPVRVAASFFAHSLVAPAIEVTSRPGQRDWPIMRTQFSTPGSGTRLGPPALVLWACLLGMGLWMAISRRNLRRMGAVIAVAILAQLALHIAFGHETFLYALDYFPPLLVLAAFATQSPHRWLVRGLACALVLTAGANNAVQLRRALGFFQHAGPWEHDIVSERARRPGDLWQRPGEVQLLSNPDGGMQSQPVHVPGGTFHPALFRFAASFWVLDARDNLLATSDNIPSDRVREDSITTPTGSTIGMRTSTPYYSAEWRVAPRARRLLELDVTDAAHPVLLVLRGFGAWGGPLRSAAWNGQRLLLNDRWTLACSPLPSRVSLGEEGVPGWTRQRLGVSSVLSTHGWAYARLRFAAGTPYNCQLEDLRPGQGVDQPLFQLH